MILPQQEETKEEQKAPLRTSFRSAEEYLAYQKGLLLGDLKGQITKHALNMLEKFTGHPDAQYKLTEIQNLGQ